MEIRKRSRIVRALVALLALTSGAVTIIASIAKLQNYIKFSPENDGRLDEFGFHRSSLEVSVEEFGCISLRFSDIKEDYFSIGEKEGREEKERLYLEFIINTLGQISLQKDDEGISEKKDLSREKENLRILVCEIRYNICKNSKLAGIKGKTSSDPSSVALRRFLGLDRNFLSHCDLETEETKKMLKVIQGHWPFRLEDVECKVFGKTLPLKGYVASILANYLLECKIEKQKRMARDANILMRIETSGEVENTKPSEFVILNDGECMSPETYMNIVREILFLAKYKNIISSLSEAKENPLCADELWFLLQKCKNSFNRNLSYKFDRILDSKPRGNLEAENGQNCKVDNSLAGFLGVSEDFRDGELRQIKEKDISILEHYQNFLSEMVDEKVYYHILDAKKAIKVKDYMAVLLLRNYKDKIYKLAGEIEKKNVSLVKINGRSIEMRRYLWFLVRLMHRAESLSNSASNKELSNGLRKLRENFILYIELLIHGRRIDHLDPPSRAVLRLLGKGEIESINTEDIEPEHSYIFENEELCISSRNNVFSTKCNLNGTEVSLGSYAVSVISKYLKEYGKYNKEKEDSDSNVFRNVNEALSIRYEDGRPVGTEYFVMVRSMFRKAFCYELEHLLRKAIFDDEPGSSIIKYYLDWKIRNIDEFFLKAFRITMNIFDQGGKRVPSHAASMIERILGNDVFFMGNIRPKPKDEKLFKSILFRFPRKYKKIECYFGNKKFRLVNLVGKAIVEYLRSDPDGHEGLSLELERSLVPETASYEE
ncbi:uncharacterized protein Eint_040340 [Encephalitozoon intestinalis ATCC 50506]|uniref:Uncharacterized protein n=1 Tax=Encephalitozoon intestinalis (strain ATCC 50506) TaxID=876142 RepID=E0S6J0_ENCIT|nr:uncharacterized protein Eint_040340 [Encephalitozoon intestinalis ATCC 50506]ADM11325.1 hypothetical protein Eint_040340 [Encephalitozoon intestinalis ATCC 50506]UTX45011.1 importin-like protein [Encephalitozoon intestinalis]